MFISFVQTSSGFYYLLFLFVNCISADSTLKRLTINRSKIKFCASKWQHKTHFYALLYNLSVQKV